MKQYGVIGMLSIAVFVALTVVAQASLNDGLVAYYPFNGNANDESGNGNNGTVYGATLAEDRFGNTNSAYNFDGQDDYIQISHTDSFNFTNGVTISIWAKPNLENTGPHSDWMYLIRKNIEDWSGAPGEMSCSIAFETVNNVYLTNLRATSDTYYIQRSSSELPADQFIHFLSVYDGSTLKLYVQGILKESIPASNNVNNTTFDIYIGKQLSYWFYKGIIDDIRIYNRGLAESEIQQLYYEGSSCETCYEAGRQACITDPESCGINIGGEYTEEQMQQMVQHILNWGDTNEDGHIGLQEAINALMISSGVKN